MKQWMVSSSMTQEHCNCELEAYKRGLKVATRATQESQKKKKKSDPNTTRMLLWRKAFTGFLFLSRSSESKSIKSEKSARVSRLRPSGLDYIDLSLLVIPNSTSSPRDSFQLSKRCNFSATRSMLPKWKLYTKQSRVEAAGYENCLARARYFIHTSWCIQEKTKLRHQMRQVACNGPVRATAAESSH